MKRPPLIEIKKTAGKVSALYEKNEIKGAVSLITAFLKKNLNRGNIESMKRFAITCKKTYGIDVPSLRIIGSALSRSLNRKKINGMQILRVLWSSDIFESKMIAGFVFFDAAEAHLAQKPGGFASIFAFLEKIIPDFENWAVCDAICTSGLDRFWSKYPDNAVPFMEKMTHETGQWQRRVPAAAIAGYCRSENFDAKTALRLLDNLAGDERIYVFKAVTWALRNMSKRNSKEVYGYLKKLSTRIERGNKARSRIIRNTISQGSQKLPDGFRKKLIFQDLTPYL